MVHFTKQRQSTADADVCRKLSLSGLLLAAGLLAGSPALAETTTAEVVKPPSPKSTILLQTTTHSNGVPIVYPTGAPQVTVRVTEIPSGADTGVHNHPTPLVTYILAGELSIRTASGATQVYKKGDVFVETTEFHRGVNEGKDPVRLLAFYIGEVGAPLSNKPPH